MRMIEQYFNLEQLLNNQRDLDNKFKEKMGFDKIDTALIKIAYLDEVGELIHELKPLWCYWKKSQKEVDKQRVLEELADCLHFALSYELNRKESEPKLEEWNGSIVISREHIINQLPSIVHIFYHIIYLLNSMEYTIEEFYQVYEQVLDNNTNVRTQNNY